MKSNILWSVLLVNLLSLAVLLGYVAMNPAEVKAYGTNPLAKIEDALWQDVARQLEEDPEFREFSEAFGIESPMRVRSRTTTVYEIADAEAGDSRPPTREQVEGRPPPRRTDLDEEDGPAIVETRFVGPLRDRLRVAPPPEDFYPFRVERRTYPNDDEMEVEILVLNRSGRLWRNATIVIGGEGRAHPPQIFEIDNWRMEGRARLRYRFPRDEVEERLRLLRVLAVRGEAIASPLLQTARPMDESAPTPRPGAEADDRIAISFEGTAEVPAMLDLPEATDETLEALLADVQTAHGHALEVQERLNRIALQINEHGARAATATETFSEEASALLGAREAFDSSVIALSVRLARSGDPGVRDLQDSLRGMSEALFSRLDAFERQVRGALPDFALEDYAAE